MLPPKRHSIQLETDIVSPALGLERPVEADTDGLQSDIVYEALMSSSFRSVCGLYLYGVALQCSQHLSESR